MGANQSSKSFHAANEHYDNKYKLQKNSHRQQQQVEQNKASEIYGGSQRIKNNQANNSDSEKRISRSLRKSVSNVLSGSSLKSTFRSSRSKENKLFKLENKDNLGRGEISLGGEFEGKSLHNNSCKDKLTNLDRPVESYYVSPSYTTSNTTTMNNHLTTQQQRPILLANNNNLSKQHSGAATLIGQMNGNNADNNNYVVHSSGAARTKAPINGNYYVQQATAIEMANSMMMMKDDGSFNCNNIAQDSHEHSLQNQQMLYTANSHINCRSQQQEHQQTKKPYSNLYKTVTSNTTDTNFRMNRSSNSSFESGGSSNVSTASNGAVAMPNKLRIVGRQNNATLSQNAKSQLNQQQNSAAPKLNHSDYSQTYQYQQINNNNCSTNQQAYLSPNNSRQSGYILDCNSEKSQPQQYYVRNLLDNDNFKQSATLSQMNAMQRRYKSPQQQYQYLNNQSAIDFHQATYNKFQQQQATTNNFLPHQLTLDFKNYNNSYAFESQTLDTKRKNLTQNPLSSLFTNNTNKHSNTIHLGRRDSKFNANQINNNKRRSSSGSLKRIKSAPLSAQQATYEAMRTIDMYLIRQIARSCMVSSKNLFS